MAFSISALPDDAQLAILARVPCADLRSGVAATCKTWSQFVTSNSLRATRAAAGWLESAVFAAGVSPRTPTHTFLLTASGAHQTAQRPQTAPIGPENPFDMSAAVALGHEVVIFDTPQDDATTARVFALDPRKNSWRELAPFPRPGGVGGATIVASGFAGGRIFAVGNGALAGEPAGPHSRRVDMYDPTRDEWSQLADMPTNESWHQRVEVAGKLYFLFPMRSADTKSTMIFDPAMQSWAPGPQLPYDKAELSGDMVAFERQGRLCVMSSWELGDGSSAPAVLAYDPSTDDWSLLCGRLYGSGVARGHIDGPIPFPPLRATYGFTQVDGTVYVWGANPYPTTYAMFMLRPGSTSWVTVPLPAGLLEESNLLYATKIVGVRM